MDARSEVDSDPYVSISRVRTTESVVEHIEQLIMSNQLKIGDALPAERDLATRLAVSRNVLREALGVLAQRGLVQSIAGRGTFVSSPTLSHMTDTLQRMVRLGRVSLAELCDARLLAEPELAARAAERVGGPEDVAELASWMARLDEAERDAVGHVEADLGFHAEIARMAGNSVFEAIVSSVREPVVRSMMTGTAVPRAMYASDEHHRKIFAAISAGDVKRARAAMEEHLRYVAAYISEMDARG